MDDWLIDDDRLSVERKSLLPVEGFFYPDSLEEEQKESEAVDAMEGVDTVVVADTDADGLGCVALIRELDAEAGLVPSSPHELQETIEWAAEYAAPAADVYVCDLCPDSTEELAAVDALVDRVASVTWFDHHQWDDEVAAYVRSAGIELTVGESGEVCTADVAYQELDHDFDAHFEDLTAVTRDHDLWIKEDDRSDDLADYARWADTEEYVETVREHGADFPEDVQQLIDEKRVEKHALIDKAVERAELREVDGWTVGITYGRCSQNEVAERLREQGSDAAVIVKPYGSVSIRGSEGFERAHEVAGQLNGGGHPRAAGCKPGVYDDMLDYAHHWTTRGALTKQKVLDAFHTLPDEDRDAEQ
jgi:oligoribonuclease NrnB/cAMP/cGMP phosphodiesterase (DHH superfamily)